MASRFARAHPELEGEALLNAFHADLFNRILGNKAMTFLTDADKTGIRSIIQFLAGG